jgi:LuxR family maltose regulon positive regulatory protein
MDDLSAPILITKLHIPTPRSRRVERPRLLAQLMGQPDAGLVLLCAPAGYGKTTLLTEWARHLVAQNVRVAWLSLEENDNDPLRFWTYVIHAFRCLPDCARLGENLLDLLRLPEPPPLPHLITLLINELAALEAGWALILDDYHTISDSEIQSGLVFLLNHLPAQLRVVIASRITPHLPLPRLRARAKILELRAEDLRFTPAESARFLTHVMELDLEPQDAAALDLRTEGWAAGLQLAALSLHGNPPDAAVQPFGGDDRYVLDYLIEEVLGKQPPAVQNFLLQTSLLARFCGPLCDAVVQIQPAVEGPFAPETGPSQAIFETLEAANLFIIPLDPQRRWYRYHHLFADLLRHQLERQAPQLIAGLHRRASAWFEAQGWIDEAVYHAGAADPDLAAGLIERHYTDLIARFDCGPLVQWLSVLPEGRIQVSPALCLARAWINLFQIHNERCDEWLEKAEAVLFTVTRPEELRSLRGQMAAIRSTVAIGRSENEQALEYARQALDNLTPAVALLRALIHLNIGDAYMREDFEISAQSLREAICLSGELTNPGFTMICAGSLVNVFIIHGRLREAAQAYHAAREIEARWMAQGGRPLPEAGKLLGSYAQILYQWNDLEAAQEIAAEGILRCEEWGHSDHILDARLALAHIQQASGRPDEANAGVAQARLSLQKTIRRVQSHSSLAREKKLQRSIENLAYQEAFIALQQNRLADVEGWVALKGADHLTTPGDRTLYAWLLLRRGQSAAAIPFLESAAADPEQRGYRIRIRALALLAWACQDCGQPERALAILAQAVTLAEPEGYLAPFLEIGSPLIGLLELLSHRLDAGTGLHAYLTRLRSAFNARTQSLPSGAPPRLVEALTERERDVLRLLSQGRSNSDIAAALFVSVNTIKTHIKHLYGKLAAETRVELVEKSRRLGLL